MKLVRILHDVVSDWCFFNFDDRHILMSTVCFDFTKYNFMNALTCYKLDLILDSLFIANSCWFVFQYVWNESPYLKKLPFAAVYQ